MINCIVSKNNWSELVLVFNSLHIHKEDSSQSEICGRHSSRMTQHDHWTTAINAINVMRDKNATSVIPYVPSDTQQRATPARRQMDRRTDRWIDTHSSCCVYFNSASQPCRLQRPAACVASLVDR